MSYHAVPPMALPPVPPPPPPPPMAPPAPLAPSVPGAPSGVAPAYIRDHFDYVARDLVEALDRDKNRHLDATEFRSVHQARLDTDGDGVTYYELANGLRAQYDEASFGALGIDSEAARRGAWNAAEGVRALGTASIVAGVVASGITAACVGVAPVALLPLVPFVALGAYLRSRHDRRFEAGQAVIGGYVDAILERRPLPPLDFAGLTPPAERWAHAALGAVVGAIVFPFRVIGEFLVRLTLPIWFPFLGRPAGR